MEILLLFSFYTLILISILGFGHLGSIILNKSKSLSELGFMGLLILILISFITNFFLPHSFVHNLILIIIGLISFIFFILKKEIDKQTIILISAVFLILFVGLLMYKNHDDFFIIIFLTQYL